MMNGYNRQGGASILSISCGVAVTEHEIRTVTYSVESLLFTVEEAHALAQCKKS